MKYEAFKCWCNELKITSIVFVGAQGMITKNFIKYFTKTEFAMDCKACLLGSERILRKVLDYIEL